MDGPPGNDFCSVCHGNFHIPCQANCSHWFCVLPDVMNRLKASKIFSSDSKFLLAEEIQTEPIAFYKFGIMELLFSHANVRCVAGQITLLIPSEASSRQRQNAEVSEILQKLEHYNRLFGERPNGLSQRMQDLPFLLRRLLRDIMDPQRSLPLVIRARVYLAAALSALYVLSPVDIIPEGLLGIIGLLDDFLIVMICFLHVAAIYRSFLLARHVGS